MCQSADILLPVLAQRTLELNRRAQQLFGPVVVSEVGVRIAQCVQQACLHPGFVGEIVADALGARIQEITSGGLLAKSR